MIHALPPSLAARVRPLNDRAPRDVGFVLAWPRTSLRADENPLLDAAILAANALGLPVAVVHALSERYPHASARHHTFALQGHRDLARGLARRGVASAFHLERPGHRGPHLRALAAGAALVVTDDMPVRPLTTWAERLAQSAPCPVWAVDTACVVPMNAIGRAHDRASRFRDVHARLRDGFLGPPLTERADRSALPDLPFAPVDLGTADLAALVDACEVDPTVGPVADTPGGSEAGYARWREFVRGGGLRRYARDRNDASLDGVSRMSAYLHYGMVAATRLAREARAHGGESAEKWCDELMIWRELAYCWCRFGPDVDGPDALPAWARATLDAHRGDPRPASPDLDALARGRTGDPLWDLAQSSLVRRGELHNNVRMTWGKALIGWTPDREAARRRLVDLNHRYALDGRDPASYGGLYWCLGLFDRPFTPEQPILGAIRPRPTAGHAARLDLARYAAVVRRPPVADPPTVAVVGLGPAGAMLARTLVDHGVPVIGFDKGRGPGGRLSTRRTDDGPFDHGAPGLGPIPRALDHHLAAWIDAGLLSPWAGGGGSASPTAPGPDRPSAAEPDADLAWAITGSTNRFVRDLLADVPSRFGVSIARITRAGGRFVLFDAHGEIGRADQVVVAVPGAQAAPLLAEVAPDLAARAATIRHAPAWVAMLAFDVPISGSSPLAATHPDLSRIVDQGRSPGRPPGSRLAVTASAAFTEANLEAPADAVAARLAAATCDALGLPPPRAASAHRWRYARVAADLGAPSALDGHVGLCGDGVAGDGAGRALWSGAHLAGALLGRMGDAPAQMGLFGGR